MKSIAMFLAVVLVGCSAGGLPNTVDGGADGLCDPMNCVSLKVECGPVDDGCHSLLNCGVCDEALICNFGVCR